MSEVEIPDEAVEAALIAWFNPPADTLPSWTCMRSALAAALPHLTVIKPTLEGSPFDALIDERDARIKALEQERIEVDDLAVAMAQLLDDMQEHGLSVCLTAKAEARVAMEPFLRRLPQDDLPRTMTLEAAIAALDQAHA